MAGEIDNINRVKEIINEVSPSFCLAKWKQVSIHLQMEEARTHSCHHPSSHPIPLAELKDNPSALHNTNHKKAERKQMLEGDRPSGCQYCWNVEDLPGNYISDRYTKSSEPWALPHVADVLSESWDHNTNPSYVEVSFSNVCNFKCSYCSPVHSSQWVREIEKKGPYKLTSILHNDLEWYKETKEMPRHHNDPNPYVDAFWKWWPDLVKELQTFRITGGEPLLDRNTFKVLDFIYDNPQPQLELDINSNGCVTPAQIDKYISKIGLLLNEGKIKKSRLYTSVDGHGKQAEYGRDGLDYTQWYDNIDRILTEIPDIRVTVMCTTNIFSITSFKKLLEDILVLKEKHKVLGRRAIPITLDMSILRWPGHQCAAILPEEYADFMTPALDFMQANQENTGANAPYEGFFDFEIQKLKRFIEFMKNPPNKAEGVHLPTARSDFYLFVNEHDVRRGTNFLETFPELEPFYRMCEKESNNRII